MKLKGKRSQLGDHYDTELGCFTDGYMVNCKGGGGTTTTSPSVEQRAILNKQLGFANKMEGLGAQQFFGGDTLAEQDPFSVMGLQMQKDAAAAAGGISDTAGARFQDAMAYDPTQDPRTEMYLDAMTAPLEREFAESTMPGISTAAVKAGAFGGDRADVLGAQASRDLAGQMGEVRSKGMMDLIDSNRRQQLGMLGQVPSLQSAALQGSQIMRDVGAGYEGRGQAEIDAARERFEFDQDAPRQNLRDASGMLSGIDFGSITKQTGGGK